MASKSSRKSTAASSAKHQTSLSSSQVTTSSSESGRSPLSPTRLTRLQEKLELQNLNDRLAAYIDRVRFLETENSRLSTQNQTLTETRTREITSVKTVYEKELSDTRNLLDETAKEKAKLQIECTKWKTELDEVQQKLQKKEKELASTEKKLYSAESHVQDLQARVNQLLSEKKRLEDALKTAESERDKLSKQLADAKARLEEESVYKVDLLNKIQSVKEELSFKETVHEQELNESRIVKQTEISGLDLNLKDVYEQKLADTLRELREQYETQMRINRDEVETIYETKLAELQTLCDQYGSNAQGMKTELRESKTRIETYLSKVKELESQNESLKSRIKDLEALLEQERNWHQLALENKEDELKNLRQDMEKQLQEYKDLLDIKVALDMEIAAYRKLLEVEETRLHITPFQSPATPTQRSTPMRVTPMRGAKRKRTMLHSGEKSSSDFQSNATAKGDVEISDHDPAGKFVKLFNKGDTDIPIGGWHLVRKAGEQETTFKFHGSTIIKSKSTVTVWSSGSGVTHSPPSDIVMKGQKWFTSESMSTTLLNNNSEEMAVRETSKRIHRSSEQRFTEHLTGEDLYHQQGDPQNPQERCVIM